MFLATAALVAACGNGAVFNKEAWIAERGNYEGASRRGAMVAGLPEAGIRPGATRAQVRALLGEPDSSGPSADIYYLGRSPYGIDYESYEVHYSPAGLLTSTRIDRS